VKVRGRIWLGLWLLLFLAVAIAIVARQRAALDTAAELNRLRERRLTLEAKQAEFEGRIREASSRKVLVPKAESRLGLRLPSDGRNTNLTLPAVAADSGS
jgi:cell division protein FtsL